MVFIIFLWVLVTLVVLAIGFLSYRNYKAGHGENSTQFRHGIVPKQAPDGFYQGHVAGYKGGWRGKRFDPTKLSGVNVFESSGRTEDRYPFRTYVDMGLKDPNQVIKIDYNLAENPWWLRLILDEIVEVEPNHFLGKLQLRLPGVSFTLGYFELQK